MFTSDTKPNRQRYMQTVTSYLLVTLFCVMFGGIYERFSHEVYSFFMIYAFVFPLAGGVLPFFLLMKHKKAYPSSFAASCYHAGIATLTTGSLLCGALEIYGTTNVLTTIYWILGAALLFVGISAYLIIASVMQRMKKTQKEQAA